MSIMQTRVEKFTSLQMLSKQAAEYISKIITQEINKKGWCTVVLSGGKTPQLTYEYLSRPEYAGNILWEHVHLFWGDERCVPPEDPLSNFNMVNTALLSKTTIPSDNIYPVQAKPEAAEQAARAYEEEIKDFFLVRGGEDLPCFDLMLLGMGTDGHTASLFPGDSILDEKQRLVCAVCAPDTIEPQRRITLTLPAINNTGRVLFLVSGREKKGVVEKILDNRKKAARFYPAARVVPRENLVWFINESNE